MLVVVGAVYRDVVRDRSEDDVDVEYLAILSVRVRRKDVSEGEGRYLVAGSEVV